MPAQPTGPGPMPVRLVLTQADAAADDWIALARGHGIGIVRCPLLQLQPVDDAAMDHIVDLVGAHRRVFLPSPSAASLLVDAMRARGVTWPTGTIAGVPGPGTAQTLQRRLGTEVVIEQPPRPPHDARHWVARIPAGDLVDRDAFDASCLVLVRADGRTAWLEALAGRGARVVLKTLYHAVPAEPSVETSAALEPMPWVWVIGAASQVDTLARWFTHPSWQRWRSAVLAAPLYVPHPSVAQHARACGHADVRVYVERRAVFVELQSAAVVPTL